MYLNWVLCFRVSHKAAVNMLARAIDVTRLEKADPLLSSVMQDSVSWCLLVKGFPQFLGMSASSLG